MKELTLIRHAKSDWGNEYLKDIDRHLNDRGYSDAYLLSSWFSKNHRSPDLILSSSATRALNTALIFARALDFNMENFIIEKDIYESTSDTLISILKKQPDTKNSIMLFGHNPGITDAFNELCDKVYIDNIPTCGIMNLSFKTDSWKNIKKENSHFNFQQFPKEYKNN